jgi:hypothetical protein
MFQKYVIAFVVAASMFAVEAKSAPAPKLEGAWSGGGRVWLASGAKEYARCRASYSRRSKERYVVTAVCATPSVRVVQTASLRRLGDNRYRGTFLNREYGVSGTILVRVWGNRQTVRLTSSSGWALLRLSRVLRH